MFRAFYLDILDNYVTAQVHLLVFCWKLTSAESLIDNGHTLQHWLVLNAKSMPKCLMYKIKHRNLCGNTGEEMSWNPCSFLFKAALGSPVFYVRTIVPVVMWESRMYFTGMGAKGHSPCISKDALEQGTSSAEDRGPFHLCLLKKTCIAPWVVIYTCATCVSNRAG